MELNNKQERESRQRTEPAGKYNAQCIVYGLLVNPLTRWAQTHMHSQIISTYTFILADSCFYTFYSL